MSDTAIVVENLGKMYRIGAGKQQPQDLWQAARSLAASPFDYLRRMRRPPTDEGAGSYGVTRSSRQG